MENGIRSEADQRRALVFGSSGQIGKRLLANLVAAGWQVSAVTRQALEPMPGVVWQRGDLSSANLAEHPVDAVFSCGPLDHFARWYAASSIDAPRVVAFGSTSVDVKQDSSEPAERDVARRL
ncbi:MAG: NmrA family NAD(P)-binding protein, partial [Stenotrophomonas sp.]